MEELVACKLCSAASHLKFNIKGYVQHVQLFHAHQANFKIVCGINGCQRTYSNFGTFSNHVYAMHHQSAKAMCSVQLESNMPNCDHDYDTTDGHDYDDNSDTDDDVNYDKSNTVQTIDCDHELCCSQEFLQKSSATFLLGLKEKFKLTQVALQGVIQGVTALNHQNMISLKAQVCVATF